MNKERIYQKGEPTIQPKKFLVIISGGEKREKDYFMLLDKAARFFPNIKVAFNSDPARLDPDGMLLLYKELHKRYEQSESEDMPDDYYLLSDVDHFRGPLLRIMPECEKEGARLVVSNPCFEVWLYYSERADKFDGFEAPEEPLQISSAVKEFLDKQIAGGVNPKKAILKIAQNIANAKANYQQDASGLPALFATDMYRLAEDIQPYVEEGIEQYNKWLEEQRQLHSCSEE